MGKGWISLHRSITENPLWFLERFTKSMAWVDMLLLANYEPTAVYIRGVKIQVQRGQLCSSVVFLAKRWKWNKRTVSKFLKELESKGSIQCGKSNVATVITLTNYDLYQACCTKQAGEAQSRAQAGKGAGKKRPSHLLQPVQFESWEIDPRKTSSAQQT